MLDADGLIVAPGFVDLHTHYDAQLFWDPYCTLSGWHGVTSVVIGNCGFGFAPVRARGPRARDAVDDARRGHPLRRDAGRPAVELGDVSRVPRQRRAHAEVGQPAAVHAGRSAARLGARARARQGGRDADRRRARRDAPAPARGDGRRRRRLVGAAPRPRQRREVQRDFDGTPMVTDVMHDETCLQLAEVLAERNDGFIQMTLGEGRRPTLDHLEQLAEISGRPVLWNVVQAFDHMPEVHRGQLEWLRRVHARGASRSTARASRPTPASPSPSRTGTCSTRCDAGARPPPGRVDERLHKLADPARRPALRDEPSVDRPGRHRGDRRLRRRSRPRPSACVNKTIGDIAEQLGKHPIDAMLDIAVADGLETTFFSLPANASLDGFRELMIDPYLIPGVSDGGAHTKFLTAGRYPTETIIRAVREHEILSLEEAHWKLSALPAHCAGFTDRGTLEVGKAADIVVYDFDRLDMTPVEKVHDFPGGEWRRVQRGVGYRYVLVNGEVTIDDDNETGVAAGRLLRHAGSRQ